MPMVVSVVGSGSTSATTGSGGSGDVVAVEDGNKV